MTSGLEQLDPNIVIKLTYSKENLARFLAEFSVRGIHVLTRPGDSADTLYAFLRISLDEKSFNDVYDISQNLRFVHSVTPLYTAETEKRLDALVANMEKRELIRLPTEHDLFELVQLTGNAEQSLYFAFIAEYIRSMLKFGIIGLLVRIVPLVHSYEFNYLYTILLLVWTLYFTATWVYAKKPYYKSKFSTVKELSFETAATRRYKATHAPPKMGLCLKKISFIPITCLFAAIIVVFQVFCFGLDIFLNQLSLGPFGFILSTLPALLLAVFTPVITILYDRYFVAKYLSFEDGPLPRQSRTEKLFILRFLTSYLPLLITLFLYMPFGYKISLKWKTGMGKIFGILSAPLRVNPQLIDTNRYEQQIFYFTVNAQLLSLFLENFLPLLLDGISKWQEKKNKPTSPDKIVEEIVRDEYPSEWKRWKLIKDYQAGHWGVFDANEAFQSLIIQFGYVAMFSTIWPLMPLIYCVFNYATLKLNLWRAVKRCTPSTLPGMEDAPDVKEPALAKAPEISDSWDIILQFVTLVGSVISPILTLMYADSRLPVISHYSRSTNGMVLYLQSPVKHGFLTILISAMVFEHLSILLFFMIGRIQAYSLSYPGNGVLPDFVGDVVRRLPQKIDLFPVALEGNQIMDKIHEKCQQRITPRKGQPPAKGQTQLKPSQVKEHLPPMQKQFFSHTETAVVRNDTEGQRTDTVKNDSSQTMRLRTNHINKVGDDYGYVKEKGHRAHSSVPLASFNTTPHISEQEGVLQDYNLSAEEDAPTIETSQLYDQGELDTAGATLPSGIYVSEANAPKHIPEYTTTNRLGQQGTSHPGNREDNTSYEGEHIEHMGDGEFNDNRSAGFSPSEPEYNPKPAANKAHIWTTLRDNRPKETRRAARLRSKSQNISANSTPFAAAAATSALYGERASSPHPGVANYDTKEEVVNSHAVYGGDSTLRAPDGGMSTSTNEGNWIGSTLRQPEPLETIDSDEPRTPSLSSLKLRGEARQQNYAPSTQNDRATADGVVSNDPSEYTYHDKSTGPFMDRNLPLKSGAAPPTDAPSKRRTLLRKIKEIF